jgi:hypothetical protein
MYKCPKAECNEPEIVASFWRESKYFVTETLDASGEVEGVKTWKQPEVEGVKTWKEPDYGSVRCSRCSARAEWIDHRQTELFPIAPTLCA